MSLADSGEQRPAADTEAPEEADASERVRELREVYGSAFNAYEKRYGQELSGPEETSEAFLNSYWASFPNRKAFIDSTLAMLGWSDAITDATGRHGINPELLHWNYSLLLERFQEAYELLEGGGEAHVFLK